MKKCVLITGADGFIGSRLVKYLLNKGYLVGTFCLYNSINFWGGFDTFSRERNFPLKIDLEETIAWFRNHEYLARSKSEVYNV